MCHSGYDCRSRRQSGELRLVVCVCVCVWAAQSDAGEKAEMVRDGRRLLGGEHDVRVQGEAPTAPPGPTPCPAVKPGVRCKVGRRVCQAGVVQPVVPVC